uniref:Rho-GAP domain-containing protein n=2 Tax=Arion vulgaris TaxID=1028688 RepID=A0A0B6Z140_9EUPU
MEDCDLDKAIQFQLVSFMLDYYDDIFTPPSDMKTHVSDRLKALQRPQVVYSPKPERTVRFCQQTSVTDFENQRVFSSHTALENLLEDIISDKNMKMKEKQKRLEQFQRTYPASTSIASQIPSLKLMSCHRKLN